MTTQSPVASTDVLKKTVGLKTNALGVWALFAQGVAAISPTMTAVLIIPLAFSSAGEGTWLAYAFGTVMLLTVVFCLNQFAKRSASAGSMYAYTGRGLGAKTGVLSGWTLIWSYFFIAVAGMCGFAVFCGSSSRRSAITVPSIRSSSSWSAPRCAGSSPTRTYGSPPSSPWCSKAPRWP